MGAKINTVDYKWSKVFLEIALRAIRRVHYEYGIWGLGQQRIMNSNTIKKINMAHGIELAEEVSVCAAITQEFMASPSVAGLWEYKKNVNEDRYFSIEREKKYDGNDNRVDIFIQKYKRDKKKDKDTYKPVAKPSFIEAKRASRWTMKEGKVEGRPRTLTDKVKRDIEKLRKEMEHRKAKKNADEIYCHLLVWGVYKENSKTLCSPEIFFQKLNDKDIKMHKPVKWLPLVWEVSKKDDNKINVTKSLWIALWEVEPSKTAN